MGRVGSITALYTVLSEDESSGDPVAEEVRGILDGHMILSRQLAAKNQYPAIDVLASLSRVMPQIVSPAHVASAGGLRALMAKYNEVETLLQVGEYARGHDAEADVAIDLQPAIKAFLNQRTDKLNPYQNTLAELTTLAK